MSLVGSVTEMNRTVLLTMHELALRDPVYAAAKFNLSPDDVQSFVSLPVEALEKLASCCDTPLFTPAVHMGRLAKLVRAPAPVAALILASRQGGEADTRPKSRHA